MLDEAILLIRRAGVCGRRAVLAAALAVAGCSSTPDDILLTDRAAGAFVAGDYEGAEAHLREALEINPDNGYSLLALAAVFERTDRATQARMVYAETLARFAGEEFSVMGMDATERRALAALARENLARLKDESTRQEDAAATNLMIKSVFGDLQDVTENLNNVSRDLFGNFKKISDNLEAISKSILRTAAKPTSGGVVSPKRNETKTSQSAQLQNGSQQQNGSPQQNGVIVPSLGPGIKVHLASYRSVARANQGWVQVQRANTELLGQLDHGLVRVDLGTGMGVFYRLLAGPIASESQARRVCGRLKARGEFCELVFD